MPAAQAACPRCGLAAPSDAAICPRCGATLPAADVGERSNLLLADDAGRHWLLVDDEAVVGRGRDAQVAIAHDSVSRRHARISRRAADFVVEDLGSRNWTLVNGERVASERVLADGDRVTFGEVELAVVLQPAAPELAAPLAELGPSTMEVDVGQALAAGTGLSDDAPTELIRRPDDAPIDAGDPLPNAAEVGPPADEAPLDAPTEPEAAPEPRAAEAETLAALAVRAASALGELTALTRAADEALAVFEAAGGRPTAAALLEQVRRTEANPLDVRELMALGQQTGWLAAHLEALIALADALRPGQPEL